MKEKRNMKVLEAVLIDWTDETDEPPGWLPEKLDNDGIKYVVARSLTKEALVENAGSADAIVTAGHRRLMVIENMAVLPILKAIIKLGSGVDNIDVKAATELGILVINTPDGLTDSVSEHTIAMMLTAVRQISRQNSLVRQGVWKINSARPGRLLKGATVGLIGFGRIARSVVRKLSGFEMKFIAYDPYIEPKIMEENGMTPVELPRLLSLSDFVLIHCPLTETTRHLLAEDELKLMKSTAILVNTSRGQVIDEQSLYHALKENWIAGAALDVLEKEPPDQSNPLFKLDNVILT
ncbi:C-terminal binding protein, partial [Candidatus Peregrinibacteria bacterium]|nr:C-terminal binding protein [Candidatus Peregrinibacteria bacterium]